MTQSADQERAEFDTLNPEVAAALRVLRRFFEVRDEALARHLYGRNLKPSHLRDCLLRVLLIEFAEGRQPTLAELQRLLARVGSPSAIANEVREMIRAGVIWRGVNGRGRAGSCHRPTAHCVNFYNMSLGGMDSRFGPVVEALSQVDGVRANTRNG